MSCDPEELEKYRTRLAAKTEARDKSRADSVAKGMIDRVMPRSPRPWLGVKARFEPRSTGARVLIVDEIEGQDR